MHPYLSTKASQRRRTPVMPGTLCLIKLALPAASVTSLRQVVTRVCGASLQFVRIDSCPRSGLARVSLCVEKDTVDGVVEAVMRYLPDAKFDSFSDASLPAPARAGAQ